MEVVTLFMGADDLPVLAPPLLTGATASTSASSTGGDKTGFGVKNTNTKGVLLSRSTRTRGCAGTEGYADTLPDLAEGGNPLVWEWIGRALPWGSPRPEQTIHHE